MRKIKCLVYELNSLAVFCYDDPVLFAVCFTFIGSRKIINMERGREGRKKGNSMIRITQLFTANQKHGFTE